MSTVIPAGWTARTLALAEEISFDRPGLGQELRDLVGELTAEVES